MAEMRWSLLEIVDRLARKMNLARPVNLYATELAQYPVYVDLIDTIDEVVQDLMIRMWPEEIKATQRILTVAQRAISTVGVTLGSASITASASAGFASTDVSATGPNKKVWISGLEKLITISAYSSATAATLAETWPITSQTAGTGYVVQDAFKLNDDFSRPMTPLSQFIAGSKVSYVPPTIFDDRRRSRAAISFGEPTICTITMDEDGARNIVFDPVPDQAYVYELNYYKVIPTFKTRLTAAPTTANALYSPIPADQQSIILYSVLREVYSYQNQDPRAQLADADMRERLSLNASSAEMRGGMQVTPVVNRSSKRLFGGGLTLQQLANKYDLGDTWDKM